MEYLLAIYVLALILVLALIRSAQENYFDVYEMPYGIPKTYISTHFVYNRPCPQNQQLF
jgi:hypothetical protein